MNFHVDSSISGAHRQICDEAAQAELRLAPDPVQEAPRRGLAEAAALSGEEAGRAVVAGQVGKAAGN